jgi:hypothetical protein
MQGISIIPCHVKAAALGGSFRSEVADDHMTTRPYGVQDRKNIALTLARIDKEVKHSAIMPYVERVGWQIGLADISTKPVNALSGFSEPCSCYIQRGLGDIQDR